MFIQIFQQYWWAAVIYFLIGFCAYWCAEKKSSIDNSFWEGLIIATFWGVLWPMFGLGIIIGVPIVKFEKWFEKRYNQTIVVFHLAGAVIWLYCSTKMLLEGALAKSLFKSLGGFISVLFWLWLGYFLIKNVTVRPPLSPYEKRWIEEIKRKKEQSGDDIEDD